MSVVTYPGQELEILEAALKAIDTWDKIVGYIEASYKGHKSRMPVTANDLEYQMWRTTRLMKIVDETSRDTTDPTKPRSAIGPLSSVSPPTNKKGEQNEPSRTKP